MFKEFKNGAVDFCWSDKEFHKEMFATCFKEQEKYKIVKKKKKMAFKVEEVALSKPVETGLRTN